MAGNPETTHEPFDFGIEETSIGSPELLEGLVGGDTDPDDVEEIEEGKKKPKKEVKKAVPKKAAVKAIPKTEDDDADEEDEDEDDFSLDRQFDEDEEDDEEVTDEDEDEDEDDEDEEEEKKPAKTAKKKKEEEAEEDSDEEESDEEADDSTDSPFGAISKELFRLGVFNLSEDEEEEPEMKSGEEFLQRFEMEKKRGAVEVLESFLSKYGEEHRNAFQAIFINGVSPQEYLQAYTQIENYKDLQLDGNEANQEKVVREALRNNGFDVEDIDAEIERIKNYGDLENLAKRYHKALVKREETKLQELSEKKEREKADSERQDKAYQASIGRILTDKAKSKGFDGIPVSQKDAQETFAYMSAKKYKTTNGEFLTEFDRDLLELKRPENHELRVKLALLMRNKLDLSKVKQAAVSTESRELFSELAVKKKKKKAAPAAAAKGGKSGISSWF